MRPSLVVNAFASRRTRFDQETLGELPGVISDGWSSLTYSVPGEDIVGGRIDVLSVAERIRSPIRGMVRIVAHMIWSWLRKYAMCYIKQEIVVRLERSLMSS